MIVLLSASTTLQEKNLSRIILDCGGVQIGAVIEFLWLLCAQPIVKSGQLGQLSLLEFLGPRWMGRAKEVRESPTCGV